MAQPEPIEDTVTTSEPTSIPTFSVTESPTVAEQENITQSRPEQEPIPTDSTPDNMAYVPGFGWLESQGPNHCEYAADMYENGNKIGIMG